MKTKSIYIALAIAAGTAVVVQLQNRAIADLQSGNRDWAAKLDSLKQQKQALQISIQEMEATRQKADKEKAWLNDALDRIVQGIKKGHEDAMEPLASWKANSNFVDIPKQFLQSLHVSAYEMSEDGDFHLSDNVAALLGMTREERARTQEAILRARNRYIEKERELMKKTDEIPAAASSTAGWSHRTTFILPSYTRESGEFQAQYRADLESILGHTRTDLIFKYGKFGDREGVSGYFDFTTMGLYDRTVTIGMDPNDSVASQWRCIDRAENQYTIQNGMGIGVQPNYIPAGWRHLLSTNMFSTE